MHVGGGRPPLKVRQREEQKDSLDGQELKEVFKLTVGWPISLRALFATGTFLIRHLRLSRKADISFIFVFPRGAERTYIMLQLLHFFFACVLLRKNAFEVAICLVRVFSLGVFSPRTGSIEC